jgi:hypothetical protein
LPLLPEQGQEQAQSLLFVRTDIDALLSTCANPSPGPEEGYFSEQGPLNRQGVEAGHVPGPVNASNVNMIRLLAHGQRIAHHEDSVQRQL